MSRSLLWLPLILALTLAIAGCVAKATPPVGELTAGGLPPNALPPSQFAASTVDPGGVTDGWLTSFNDARLDLLVADAMAYNRDLAAAKARVDQAAAAARQAGAELKPQVGYSMQAATAGSAGNNARTEQMGAGLTLSWELDVWGRLSSGQRAAQEQFASQAADFAFARQSLAAQVAKAYFLAIQSVHQEIIAQEFATVQQQTMELTVLREAGGTASKYDVALARSAFSTSQDQVRKAQSGRERAVRSLELLVGRYPKAELDVGATLPVVPGPPPAGLPSQLLERRPDVIAATRRVASAFNQVESAKAARLPRLSITANGGAVSDGFKNLSLDDLFWNIAGNIMGPIFDGGRLKEQVIIETAKQQEALALYGKAALIAFQQVEQGLAEEPRLLARINLVAAADQHQREALRLATMRFEAGTIDQVALLIVQGQALNTRLADLAVRVEHLTNRVDLHLALGGGFEPPPPTAEDSQPASKVITK